MLRLSTERTRTFLMHRLLSMITALSVMLHSTLGCCSHHSHPCQVDSRDAPAAMAGSCGCDSHHHESQPIPQDGQRTPLDSPKVDVAQQEHHSDHGDHECEGASCSFLSVQNSSGSETTKSQNQLAVFDRPVCSSLAESYRLNRSKPTAPSGGCTGLRLHLLHDILII